MSTRILIFIFGAAAFAVASYEKNLPAMMIAVFSTFIIYLLHTIGFKLNKLLDHYGIRVWDSDIAKD
ncbi:hypothetical protein [Bradyrhizobium sp. NC92]|uniref:hypothetical protein n=1 Tax=Bradyrhizobium sp. (strain NC92) TaxID=55395 RepID=UPI0021A97979|nr:hypothetical protein [Bradyrhizobium sp. NC92]UWU66115.1 hypothetical protein N2602_22965 [Bradyrhizobium sp. NC92]